MHPCPPKILTLQILQDFYLLCNNNFIKGIDMKIGILGSGVVGQQLGLGLIRLGHDVMIGTRNPDKLNEWKNNAGIKASVGSFDEAAKSGYVIVLATRWEGTKNTIEMAGNSNFSGKILIDVTNPLDFSKGFPPGMDASFGNSAGEQIQRWLPDTKVVKAFNIIGASTMCNPKMEEGIPDLFIAGNDTEAKKQVTSFAKEWGWENVYDTGDITQAYWLETLTMLWINFAHSHSQFNHAFKLLRK
jgi:NADPH-dependent F420 reductase